MPHLTRSSSVFLFYLFTYLCFLLLCRSLKAALQSISPLILLGFSRLISTTGVDYQVSSVLFFNTLAVQISMLFKHARLFLQIIPKTYDIYENGTQHFLDLIYQL